jgi:drug/metabolite transporter (DMT)-like permease
MPRLRSQDVLFALLGVALIALLTFDVGVIVLALVGAFACGSIYVFAGMIPSREDSFWNRLFTTVFLSVVLSSLVLILPGTFGTQFHRPDIENAAIAIAGLLPLTAICFEVLRTPRVIQGIRRCLGRH